MEKDKNVVLLKLEDYKTRGEHLHILCSIQPQQLDAKFIINSEILNYLNQNPFKNKLLEMIREDELPTELHYYLPRCELEFVINKHCCLEEAGIEFYYNMPIVFPNVSSLGSDNFIFLYNKWCIGSPFLGMNLTKDIGKHGWKMTLQHLVYKIISFNIVDLDLIHFSTDKILLEYTSVFYKILRKLEMFVDSYQDQLSIMFCLLLFFIHQNVKEGNIDLLRNVKEFYPKFGDWAMEIMGESEKNFREVNIDLFIDTLEKELKKS